MPFLKEIQLKIAPDYIAKLLYDRITDGYVLIIRPVNGTTYAAIPFDIFKEPATDIDDYYNTVLEPCISQFKKDMLKMIDRNASDDGFKPLPSSTRLISNTTDLKRWCVEQALKSNHYNERDGITLQAPLIPTAQEIYDWVTK